MKRIYKVSIWAIALLLLVMGSMVYIMTNQFGKMDALENRHAKFSELTYYSTERNEFISPEKLIFNPEQTTGGDPGFARFFKTSPNAPQFPLPKQMLSKNDFSETPSEYAVYWLGHSTVLLELDGKRILFDPVFENAGPLPIITRRYDVSPLNEKICRRSTLSSLHTTTTTIWKRPPSSFWPTEKYNSLRRLA
ncbi:MBL fold metallo-hydrolase [Geofilum rubicundum]|uniref:Outer membrane protein romA n=1 Tax=Geofilum rubicundum JCM 15548 TaxID=1236989 RepID=A0A0E9M390_9BACT|nr:MBL fold metallo-hydrolase [Geofilum rubicundum]GAO31979.1 hypothetical protein JCM15548_14399 [Geofilum rubicundum JCM 15548]